MYTEIPFFQDELDTNSDDSTEKTTRTFVKSEYSDLE